MNKEDIILDSGESSSRVYNIQNKIRTIEWDMSNIKDENIRALRLKQIKKLRLELKKLSSAHMINA